MISHKHKCIFIHIPKTAGMSISCFFHPNIKFHYAKPDYERLFGWCPKRKLHMQHATTKQLLETELITETQWKTYYKFTFVRNPWDRAYSDYMWVQDFAKVKGSFKDYINCNNAFEGIFNDNSNNKYLGDHLLPQSDFFDLNGKFALDFVGRFENFNFDIQIVLKNLSVNRKFDANHNKSNRKSDYSLFYSNSNMKIIEERYKVDIDNFGYQFEDHRKGLYYLKKLI
ncbi:sulfotransferase family 2 domain-containing protein [Flavobacteriaceae bacterium LMO-SS05]